MLSHFQQNTVYRHNKKIKSTSANNNIVMSKDVAFFVSTFSFNLLCQNILFKVSMKVKFSNNKEESESFQDCNARCGTLMIN